MKVEVYDPPMCCSTGLCGANIDPELLRIHDVLINLKKRGVEVHRYQMSSDMAKFAKHPTIAPMIKENGRKILPIVSVNGEIIKTNGYPSEQELIGALGL